MRFCICFRKPEQAFFLVRLCVVVMITQILCGSVRAQTKFFSSGYRVENFRKEQGLPDNIIDDITQDQKGYIWLTTPYNLVRYDGYAFKIFSPHEQFPDLFTEFHPELMADSHGFLWSSTTRHGLLRFDPRTALFRRFTAEDRFNALSSDTINCLLEDSAFNIWLGSARGYNLLTWTGDSISVKQYGNFGFLPVVFTLIQSIVNRYSPVAGITKVGNLQLKSAVLEIKKPGDYFVLTEGEIEGMSKPFDYGWIENEKGEEVWSMDSKNSKPAGGFESNMLACQMIKLKAGLYSIHYKTDGGHAWGAWVAQAPKLPDLWGIQVFALPDSVNDHIVSTLKKSQEYKTLKGNFIMTMLEDSDRHIWALTSAGIEQLIPPSGPGEGWTGRITVLPPDFFPANNMIQLTRDRFLINGAVYNKVKNRDERAFLFFNNRLLSFQLTRDSSLFTVSFSPKSFLRDRRNNYWLGSFDINKQGLNIADDHSEIPHLEPFDLKSHTGKAEDLFQQGQIWAVFEDRSGSIWVGTRGRGLFKIKNKKTPARFTRINNPDNDRSTIEFKDIAEDGEGNIWLNGLEKGVFSYNPKTKSTKHFGGLSGADSLNAFFSRDLGRSIILSDEQHGPIKLSSSLGRLNMEPRIPDSLIFFSLDGFGNVWAKFKTPARRTFRFYIFNGVRFEPVRFDSTVQEDGALGQIHFGRNGNIWISARFSGIQQYTWNNQTKKPVFVRNYLQTGIDVMNAYEDEDGIVWAGTYSEGLVRLDPKNNSWTFYSVKTGMPSNFITDILPFGKKILLITDVSPVLFDREKKTFQTQKELDEFLKQEKIDLYQMAELSKWRHPYIKNEAGELMVATTNGFYSFNLDNLLEDTVKPLLQIAGLKIADRDMSLQGISGADHLRFHYNQNDVEISYIGIHYNHTAQIQYAFLLTGANKDWVMAGTDRIARYSKLSPGDYAFYLKAANSDGVWSGAQKMFSFTILPPWWKRWWAYALYVFVFATCVWSFIRYRSRKLTSENMLLENKVGQRTAELNQSLDSLKNAQAQLIQSEKMASLGELTAGIAHEIQNPLNFVNNFSEVNTELIGEMQEELNKSNLPGAIEISNEIRANEEKIYHHGKRADGIVKSMLQHSRSNAGQRELTDINTLADEYLRLSYHGLRAKDQSFNAAMKTDFSPTLAKVMVVPQDLGRVFMNLFNNAFYAVAERKKQLGAGYEPTVWVRTGNTGDRIFISVRDNGAGIPQHLVNKIFQPFFTTKPTGQGTGLGLSLSYDVIHAHGGELKLETKEGEGTEFTILIPAGSI